MYLLARALLIALILHPFALVAPALADDPPGNHAFHTVWERTDSPVTTGDVVRTWMWGPHGYTGLRQEPYLSAPGFKRDVQYFDKSRMELTDPSGDPNDPWYVTNGLLATELITGRLQFGDDAFLQLDPAEVNVAGDPDDPEGPTYRTYQRLLGRDSAPLGTTFQHRLDRDGNVVEDPELASYGITAVHLDEVTDHSVAGPFWELMNATGLILENGNLVEGPLVYDPVFAVGRPITEAYWAEVKVDNVYQDVLTQCFERRCLTYTPANEAGWQVEAGNIGQHYYRWRYESGQQVALHLVDSSTDRTFSVDGLTLSIPAGSIDGEGILGISSHNQNPDPPEGYTYAGPFYSIVLAGTELSQPVDVTVPFDRDLFPDGVSESHLEIGRYDEDAGSWDLLDGTVSADVITTSTSDLSIWAAVVPGEAPAEAPIAYSQHVEVIASNPVTITLEGSHVDGTILDFQVTGGPSSGALSTTSPNATCELNGTTLLCTADVTYTPDAGFDGNDSFTFAVTDGTLSGSAVVTIGVTGASPIESTIDAEPPVITADGSATSTITVTLRDGSGAALGASGGAVELFTTSGSLSSITDRGDGTYTATLTASTTAETAVVSGELNGASMSDTATVDFVAGSAAIIELVSGDGGTEQVAATRELVVLVTDQFGNPVAGHTVEWQIDSGNGSLSASSSTTDSEGLASIEWTLGTEVGLQQASAISPGLSGSPVAYSVNTFPGPSAQIIVETQPSDSARSGIPFDTQPVVRLADQFGNHVSGSGVIVDVSIDPATGLIDGGTSVPTDGNGRAAFIDLAIIGTIGEYALRFDADGLSGVSSEPIDLVAGDAAQLAITTQPSSDARSGDEFDQQPVIQIQDSAGNDVDAAGITVTTSILDGDGTLFGETTAQSSGPGAAAFTDLGITGLAGDYRLEFSAPELGSVISDAIVLGPGDPTQLAIVQQPSATANSGATFPDQPVIQLLDSAGNAVPQSGVTVTASIDQGASTGDLSPDPAEGVTSSDGTATFSGLTITGTVGEYTLQFDASGLSSVTSDPIDLQPGEATTLAIMTEPPSSVRNADTLDPHPVVQLRDSAGNDVHQSGVLISVNIDPDTASLLGTLTVPTNTQGGAVFDDLAIEGPADDYALVFEASGFDSVTSQSINLLAGDVAELVILTQPSDTARNDEAFDTQPVVQLRDSGGNDVLESGVNVTVSVEDGDGEVVGTTTVPTDGLGTATFSDLAIIGLAGEYTLSFSALSLDPAISDPITLAPGDAARLTIIVQPSSEARSGDPLGTQPVIQLQDSGGNDVGAVVVVSASIASGDGELAPDPAEATTNQDGEATFSALTITGLVGDYTLQFSATDLDSATSDTIELSPGDPAQLAVETQPSSTVQAGVEFPTQPAIQVQDSAGNAVAESGHQITVEIGSGAGSLEGTLNATTGPEGIASFEDLRIDGLVGERTLRFTSDGVSDAVSTAIDVEPGLASLAVSTITADPDEIAADGTSESTITVQLVDSFGNDLTSSGGTVELHATAGTLDSVSDTGDGSYTATLTASSNLEAATITGTLDGNALSDSATVEFVPGAPAAFTVESSDDAVVAGQNVMITAQLRDATGHAVPMGQVPVTWSSTNGGSFSAATTETSSTGLATVTFTTSDTVGVTHVVIATATINGDEVTGASGGIATVGPPSAADYGPPEDSSPGDDFHISAGGTFTFAAPGLFTDSNRGVPEGELDHFTVDGTDHDPSDTGVATPDGGTLIVREDGSVTYTSDSGFMGVFTFDYTLSNEHGDSTGTVTILVGEGPEANDLTYGQTVIGNVAIDTSRGEPFSVLDNDQGEDLIVSLQSSPNGDVNLREDGTFTFSPAAGFRGEATFTYQISNALGSDTATVTLTVSPPIWFIDNNPGSCAADCDGRLTTPFTSVSDFVSNAGAQANDIVFVYQSASSYSYSGALTLANGQKLIGQDASTSLEDFLGTAPSPHSDDLPDTNIGGPNSVVLNATGPGIQLASNNVLHGFSLTSSSGVALSGTSVGNLDIEDVSINAGAQAISLTGGNVTASFDSVSSNGGTNGISLSNQTGGSISIGGGSISSSSSHGINLPGGSATLALTGVSIDDAGGHGINVSGSMPGLTLNNVSMSDAASNLVHVSSGSNVTLTVQGSSFEHTTSNAGSAFNLIPSGSANFTVSIDDSTFDFIAGHSLNLDPASNSTGTMSISFTDNTVTNSAELNVDGGRHGNVHMEMNAQGATVNLVLTGNTMTQITRPLWLQARGGISVNALVQGNNVSGSRGTGIDFDHESTGPMVVLIDDNTVSDTVLGGILAFVGDGALSNVGPSHIVVTNNSVQSHNTDPGEGGWAGIYLRRFGEDNPPASCISVTGNSIMNHSHEDIDQIFISGDTSASGSRITFEGAGTAQVTASDVAGLNTGVVAGQVTVHDAEFSNGVLCQRPDLP